MLTPEHAKLSKILLGEYSLGIGIQKELDAGSQRHPGVHRLIDHEPKRLGLIEEKYSGIYGGFASIEIAIHIAADYDWFPEWKEAIKNRKIKGKKET
jgi:hypothetical protein